MAQIALKARATGGDSHFYSTYVAAVYLLNLGLEKTPDN